MQARVRTVAFQGIDVLPVDVQVLIAPGNIGFVMVGLADKAVGESRERVRAAFRALGLALPPQRITVNLSPADSPRRAAITTCRSPSACWRLWAWCRPTASRGTW